MRPSRCMTSCETRAPSPSRLRSSTTSTSSGAPSTSTPSRCCRATTTRAPATGASSARPGRSACTSTWARRAPSSRTGPPASPSGRACRASGSGCTRATAWSRSSPRTARCSAARTTAPRGGCRCWRRARSASRRSRSRWRRRDARAARAARGRRRHRLHRRRARRRAATARRSGRGRRRLDAGARVCEAARARVRELRGAARGRIGRRRPPDDAAPPPLLAGEGGARGGQARRVREAARARRGAVGRARRAGRTQRARALHELQHPLLPARAGRAGARARGRARGDLERPRRLPAGLAAAPDRLELAQFGTGLEVEQVFADLATVVPVRRRPTGEVETFAAAADVERADAPMSTEDLAHILVRFRGGARGSCVVSQVSAGRKNAIRLEVDGSQGALAWDGERPEELWLGARDAPNGTLLRNPALLGAAARAATQLPAGHAEGFADTFRELYRAVYRAVAAGEPGDGYPTFRDGHRENVLAEAVAGSNRTGRWVEVTAS